MSTVEVSKQFNGIRVFSATMLQDRERLGDRITDWIRDNPQIVIVDTRVTQSSDNQFHCIAITVFYWEELTSAIKVERKPAPKEARRIKFNQPEPNAR